MPQVSVTENPQAVKAALEAIEESQEPEEVPMPMGTPPPSPYGKLAAGVSINGTMVYDFTVRELTGRDEEAFGSIEDGGRFLLELLSRGLVQIGSAPASAELQDQMYAGDWETVLLALRVATFGDVYETQAVNCRSCGTEYKAQIHLLDNVERHEVAEDDLVFEVKGRKNTYVLTTPTGAAQRKILTSKNLNLAEMNSVVLEDALLKVNNRPSLGRETVLDLPMADRRVLLEEIADRKPGPRLEGVKTLCPNCGVEQGYPLTIAALFQG